MVSKRLIHEEGHDRKFLCVVDSSEEVDRAVLYAERRATNVGGSLALLYVSEPESFQHWIGVEDVMRAEAKEAGEEILQKFAQFCRDHGSIDPELIFREGKVYEEIVSLVEEDQDIAVLVLAAGEGSDGPGPLVSSLANGNAYTIPVIVVPFGMTYEEIESVT